MILFEQIWPDLGDWNDYYLPFLRLIFPEIWTNLTRSRGLKQNMKQTTISNIPFPFEQIWPDLGDWNTYQGRIDYRLSSFRIWTNLTRSRGLKHLSFAYPHLLQPTIWTNLTRSRGLKRKLVYFLFSWSSNAIWTNLTRSRGLKLWRDKVF